MAFNKNQKKRKNDCRKARDIVTQIFGHNAVMKYLIACFKLYVKDLYENPEWIIKRTREDTEYAYKLTKICFKNKCKRVRTKAYFCQLIRFARLSNFPL